MKLITLHLPEPYIRALDRLVKEKFYPNRAEAIRVAVRDLLSVEAWGKKRPIATSSFPDFDAIEEPRRYVVRKRN